MTGPERKPRPMRTTQSIEQMRFSASWHESAHAVAAWTYRMPMEAIKLMAADGTTVDLHFAGRVWFEPVSPSAYDVANYVVMALAGRAAENVALAEGWFPPSAIGAVEPEGDPTELTVEAILAAGEGSSTNQAAASVGWFEDESWDELGAQAAVESFCGDETEAGAMLSWLRVRTVNVVQTPKFLSLTQRLAGALLELGTVSGAHAEQLLGRWSETYRDVEEEQTA